MSAKCDVRFCGSSSLSFKIRAACTCTKSSASCPSLNGAASCSISLKPALIKSQPWRQIIDYVHGWLPTELHLQGKRRLQISIGNAIRNPVTSPRGAISKSFVPSKWSRLWTRCAAMQAYGCRAIHSTAQSSRSNYLHSSTLSSQPTWQLSSEIFLLILL